MDKDTLKLDKDLKLVAKSSIIVFIGLFLSKILIYIYRIIIARYFGPEAYGLFSLAVMIIGWFITISSFGLINGLLRFIPQYRGKKEFEKIKSIIRFSSIILFFSSIISTTLLFFSSNFIALTIFHNPNLIIFLKMFSFLIPLLIFSNLLLAVLIAFEEISWQSFIVNVLQNVLKVIFIILFIILGFKTNAIIFSYFLGITSMFIVAYLVCRYKFSKVFQRDNLEKKLKLETHKKFISYSWPIMFSGTIANMFSWIDSFSIGYFRTTFEVGYYNAAVPIVLLLGFAPELFMQLFFPLINKEFSRKNMKVIKELSQQVGKWIFLLNLPLFLIMVLFPGAIINFLFGESYLIAENALRILALGSFISNTFYLSSNLMSMLGKSRIVLANVIVTMVINIFLNIILVPKYGIVGAAISTSISWIILSMAFLIEANYFTSIIPIKKDAFKILFASLIPLFFLIILKKIIQISTFSLIFLGFFFLLFYLLMILLTKSLDSKDIMILKSFKKKIFK